MKNALRLDATTIHVAAHRCAPGVTVMRGRAEELADVSGNRILFHTGPPGTAFTIPKSGRWMAVTAREFPLTFTLKDLLECTDEQLPGRRAPLSVRCTVTVSIVHLTGLTPLLCRYDSLDAAILARELLPPLQKACREMCYKEGAFRDQRTLTQDRAPLEELLRKAAFPVLFERGLLIRSRALKIDGFSAPEIR